MIMVVRPVHSTVFERLLYCTHLHSHRRAFAQVFRLLCLWLREWRTAHTTGRPTVDPTLPTPTLSTSAPSSLPRPPDGLGQRGAGGGLQKLRPPCPPPSAQQKRWEPPRRPGLSAAAASLPWPPGPGSLCGAAQSSICLLTSLPSALRLRGWLCGDACVSGAPPPLCL